MKAAEEAHDGLHEEIRVLEAAAVGLQGEVTRLEEASALREQEMEAERSRHRIEVHAALRVCTM